MAKHLPIAAEEEKRSCGDCIVCCVYLKIDQPELQKPALSHCKHLCLKNPVKKNELQYSTDGQTENCRIYENRPTVCKGYSCLWVQGHGDEEDRPDKSGILIDTLHSIENAIECKPIGPGFEDRPEAVAAIERISRSTNKVALVASFYERKFSRVVGRPI